MEMQEKILNAILDNQEAIQSLGVRFDAISTTLVNHDTRFDTISTALINLGIKVDDHGEKLTRIEEVQNNTYDKIDGFLTVINRHEAEIAALRSKCERLENGLEKLELKNI